MKQVTDDRGTVRELFRRSAFEAAGIALGRIEQVNLTETQRTWGGQGHARRVDDQARHRRPRSRPRRVRRRPPPTRRRSGWSTRSTSSRACRCWCRRESPTGSRRSRRGTQYAYCFDHEWSPTMPGLAFNPLDPLVADRWPLQFDSERCPLLVGQGSRRARLRGGGPMKLFVTGAAGFIGSNYVRWVLANSDHEVTVFDKLTYAGNLDNIRDVLDDRRCRFVHGDICDQEAVLHQSGRPRRGRALRGRVARRPLDRRPVRVRHDQHVRHERALRRGPPGGRRALPAHLDRRGLRLDRVGFVRRDATGSRRARRTRPPRPAPT